MRTRVFRRMILTVGLGGCVAAAWAARSPSVNATPVSAEDCTPTDSDPASDQPRRLPVLRSVPRTTVLTSEVIPTSASTPLQSLQKVSAEAEDAPARATRLTDIAEEPGPTRVTANDPAELVSEFVDRSRKEAERSIAALTKEAEELRARLKKVEAALDRWQSISRALAAEPVSSIPMSSPDEAIRPVAAEEAPQDLEPVGQTEVLP